MSLFINTDELCDIEQLKYALKENVNIASRLRTKIEAIRKIEIKEEKEEQTVSSKPIYIDEIEEIDDDTEYEYYYEPIRNISCDTNIKEIYEIIKESLPSKNNSNYFKLINRIKAEIYKEMLEFSKMVEGETDKEFLDELKKYIELENCKLGCIKKIEKEKYAESIVETENRIVFLETNAENVYAIEDIESISREYYDSFNELIESIKNGSFKSVKKFNSSNNKLNMIAEVRGFKTRILFDRVDKNTYVIIQMFVKKCDNDKGYKQSVQNRVMWYKKKRSEIIEQLANEDYLKKNSIFEDQMMELLNRNVKVKKG